MHLLLNPRQCPAATTTFSRASHCIVTWCLWSSIFCSGSSCLCPTRLGKCSPQWSTCRLFAGSTSAAGESLCRRTFAVSLRGSTTSSWRAFGVALRSQRWGERGIACERDAACGCMCEDGWGTSGSGADSWQSLKPKAVCCQSSPVFTVHAMRKKREECSCVAAQLIAQLEKLEEPYLLQQCHPFYHIPMEFARSLMILACCTQGFPPKEWPIGLSLCALCTFECRL